MLKKYIVEQTNNGQWVASDSKGKHHNLKSLSDNPIDALVERLDNDGESTECDILTELDFRRKQIMTARSRLSTPFCHKVCEFFDAETSTCKSIFSEHSKKVVESNKVGCQGGIHDVGCND